MRLVSTIALAASLICAPGLRAEIVDQLVAIVNEETITYSEVRKVLNPIYAQYQRVYEGDALLEKMVKAKEDVIEQLVENKLLAQEARRREIKIPESEVKAHIEKIRERFESAAEFEKAMQAEGVGKEQLRKTVEEQYLVRVFVGQFLAPRAVVGPQEIQQYYLENQDNFLEEEQVHAIHILVKKVPPEEKDPEGEEMLPEDTDPALDKIEKAAGDLADGLEPTEVAKLYSEGPEASRGGDLGFFGRGRMIQEIEEVAFATPVGKTSGIIESPVGYHLVYVKARKDARTMPLTQVQKEIEDELFRQKTNEARRQMVSELKKKAYIKIIE